MGLILDTSVMIDAERRRLTALGLLFDLTNRFSDNVALSTVSVMEFAVGIGWAKETEQRERRQRFLQDLVTSMEVIPFEITTAERAGRLQGDLGSKGVTVGSLDLMIGVTALNLSFGVVTRNVRHFRMIPGLRVVEL